jgi:nitrogen regulatory protein P-II 1
MVKVEAIIRPQVLEAVQEALEILNISGMTVFDVRGMGKQKGVTHTYRGSTYTLSLTAKTKIELVVQDNELDDVVAAIQKAAQTGEIGDGKIFVTPVQEAIRIRTGEKGEASLH